MMNWFYKWLGNKISNSQDDHLYAKEEAQSVNMIGLIGAKQPRAVKVRESDNIASDPIQFKMFKANGGWAIEFRQYDNRNDRVDTSLYVVNDEQELGKSISQIITMEALKR